MHDAAFDHPPAGTTSTGHRRYVGIDVARAIALIGVVAMNYNGMMKLRGTRPTSRGLLERVFDISSGVLTTRFAATFVVVAGISLAFFSQPPTNNREQSSHDHLTNTRIRVLRRGLVLLTTGYFLDRVWPGTIIFFYGAYFICAALIFHIRTRLLAVLAFSIAGTAVGIAIWRRLRFQDGDPTTWMNPLDIDSIGDFLLRVFVGYTHPILPWMTFLITGMIMGRYWMTVIAHSRRLISMSTLVIIASYVVATAARVFEWRDNAVVYALTSMQPSERGLLYILSTAGLAIIAVLIINWLAEKYQSTAITGHLQRAGQMTLTLYLLHVLFFYVVVNWGGLINGNGVSRALLVAGLYWIGAIAVASWWHHRLGTGPAERIYRWLGG